MIVRNAAARVRAAEFLAGYAYSKPKQEHSLEVNSLGDLMDAATKRRKEQGGA